MMAAVVLFVELCLDQMVVVHLSYFLELASFAVVALAVTHLHILKRGRTLHLLHTGSLHAHLHPSMGIQTNNFMK